MNKKNRARSADIPAILKRLIAYAFLIVGVSLLFLSLTPPPTFSYLTQDGYLPGPPLSPTGRASRLMGLELSAKALDDDELIEHLSTSAVRLIRVQIPWSEIEQRPGDFNWSIWDKRLHRIVSKGLTPLVVINTTPTWARAPEDKDNRWAPPAHPEWIIPFLKAFAARYGTLVTFYQVWDEPNIAPHWGAREANPYGYLRLLQIASTTLREEDPSAVIISAGLAPTLDPGRINRNDLAYLDALLDLGAGAWFDILGWEPYGFDMSPNVPASPTVLNFRRVELARHLLTSYGLTYIPIWATAMGWNAPLQGDHSPWKAVSEQQQTVYAEEAVRWWKNQAPWLQALIWTDAYPDVPVTDPIWGFALWRPDGSPRPMWETWNRLAADGSAASLQPDRLNNGTLSSSHRPLPVLPGPIGKKHEFRFQGTSVALTVLTGPRWHTLWVEIDGDPAPTLPRTRDGRAYLNTYSPHVSFLRVVLARNLPPGSHQLRIISGQGDPVWPILKIASSSSSSEATSRFLQVILAILMLTTAGILLTRTLAIQLHGEPLDPLENMLLVITAFLIPFTTTWLHVFGYIIILPEIPLVVLTLRWLYRWARAGTSSHIYLLPRSYIHAFPWLVGGTVAVLGTQVFLSPNIDAWWADFKGLLLFPALLYLFIIRSNAATRTNLVYALLGGILLAALLALGSGVTLSPSALEWPPRIRGFFDSPNHLALILVRVLPFALWIPLRNKYARYTRSLYVGILLFTLILTGSRGALLLGVPTALILAYLSSRQYVRTLPFLVIAIACLGGIIAVFRGTHTIIQRWYIWGGTFQMIRNAPWLGVGLGQFPWFYPRYALPSAWREPLLYHAHNVLFTTTALGGIPLSLLGFILLGRTLISTPKTWIGQAAKASLLAGLAFSLVDAFWSLPDLAYLTALSLALIKVSQGGKGVQSS